MKPERIEELAQTLIANIGQTGVLHRKDFDGQPEEHIHAALVQCAKEAAEEEREVEGYAGLSRDHDTGAWHHLVLLPATTDKDLTWQEAIDWAKSVGGELPTRFESALLYANLRDKIDTDYWYWTATQHADEPSWAWSQVFYDGSQYHLHKDFHYRARAVRRVPIGE